MLHLLFTASNNFHEPNPGQKWALISMDITPDVTVTMSETLLEIKERSGADHDPGSG